MSGGRRWRIVLPAIVLGGVVGWWMVSPALTASPAAAATGPPPAPIAANPGPASGDGAPPAASGPRRGIPLTTQALAERREWLAIARERLERARQTLASYKVATRYPYESRPASERSDQWEAHPTLASDGLLRMPGGTPAPGVHIHTTQQAVFATGGDSVLLTVAAVDDNGDPVTMRILSSVAHASVDAQVPLRTVAPPSVTQVFVDDGTQGDARAGDGTWTTRLQPAAEGFAGWAGLVRTELIVQANGTQGYVAFDVVYSPETPATWAGPVREVLADGALELVLPIEVAQPGRYVVTGRVDDAEGKPFALLTFNEELGAGARQVKLTIWGRLVRDQKPVFPLTLHDVEGFLLKADAYPDRALMPPRDGVVHATRKYAIATFSDAAWQSEETARYLAEYNKDVAAAQTVVDQLEQQAGP